MCRKLKYANVMNIQVHLHCSSVIKIYEITSSDTQRTVTNLKYKTFFFLFSEHKGRHFWLWDIPVQVSYKIHWNSLQITKCYSIGKLELLLVSLGSWSSSILVSYVPVFGTPQSGIWGRVRTRHCESEPLVGIVTHFKGSFSSLVKWEGDTLGLLTSSPLLGSYYSIKFGQDQTKLLKNEEADGNLLIIGWDHILTKTIWVGNLKINLKTHTYLTVGNLHP